MVVINCRRDHDSRDLRYRRRCGLGRVAARTVFRNGTRYWKMNHDSRGLWCWWGGHLGRNWARAVLASMRLVMFMFIVTLRSLNGSRDSNDFRDRSRCRDRLHVCDCHHLRHSLFHGDLLLGELGLGGRERHGHDDRFCFCLSDVADIDAAAKQPIEEVTDLNRRRDSLGFYYLLHLHLGLNLDIGYCDSGHIAAYDISGFRGRGWVWWGHRRAWSRVRSRIRKVDDWEGWEGGKIRIIKVGEARDIREIGVIVDFVSGIVDDAVGLALVDFGCGRVVDGFYGRGFVFPVAVEEEWGGGDGGEEGGEKEEGEE